MKLLKRLNKIQKVKILVNEHKTHWSDCPMEHIVELLKREVAELEEAISQGRLNDIQLECADVANLAAMIADKAYMGDIE